METHRFCIKHKSKVDVFSIIPIGDIHLGNVNCDIDYLEKLIDWVKEDDKRYVLGMGDYADCIVPCDNKRYDENTVDPEFRTPEKQYRYLKELFEPIAKKGRLIGLHTGNHEDQLRKIHYYDITLNLCRALKVKYLGWDALTRVSFNRIGDHRSFDIYSTHGFGSGYKRGSKINRMEDLPSQFDADIYLMGHNHDLFSTRTVKIFLNSSIKISERKLVFACTGTFLRDYVNGVTSYMEKRGYKPNKIGVVKITINPYHNDIHISE